MREDVPSPKLALVLVGLPARGKSSVAAKITRFLCWQGYRTRVFNVGNYRRERLGADKPHTFFDPDNREATELREQLAGLVLDDMLGWLAAEGDVAIFDAVNAARARRAHLRERCARQGIPVLLIENICDDDSLVEATIRDTKVVTRDYRDIAPEAAARDFRLRIAEYAKVYETLADDEAPWIKVVDGGVRIHSRGVRDYGRSHLLALLNNLRIARRPIYLARHGESEFNELDRIGGDAGLSPLGRLFARSLAAWLDERFGLNDRLVIWTSALKRSVETAEPLSRPFRSRTELHEIDAGSCDGLTYEQIAERYPQEFAARKNDKLRYRYPKGESYEDVIRRLIRPVIELERVADPILILSHQAVLRVLYAYLCGSSREEIPYLSIPLHTVIELVPRGAGYVERRIPLAPKIQRTHASSS
jgi:broad specificity phosphatase PhoE/predicted kinase